MKRIILLISAALMAASCGVSYNKTKHFDEAHFAELQKIISNPPTPENVQYVYTEATELNLVGKIMDGTPNPYARVDTLRYKGFTKGENKQVRVPAGLAVLFKTNSSTISIKTVWGEISDMSTTMPLSYGGYDLYIKNEKGEWTWAADRYGNPSAEKEKEVVLTRNLKPGVKECILYLPIYCEVRSCRIGVEEGATLEPLESPFRHRIVFHGSSFTHGISTSRPGMSYPMQFMRHTGLQVLALGCSGNCKMQPYFADVLEDVEADAYIFDSFSNPNYKMIKQRLIPFLDRMVAAHPGKPIIFQQTIWRENRNFNMYVNAVEQAKMDMASTMFHEILKEKKYKDVYFITPNACEKECHEYSVDGTHPDDHGYYLWAKSIEKPVLRILRKYGIK